MIKEYFKVVQVHRGVAPTNLDLMPNNKVLTQKSIIIHIAYFALGKYEE